MITSNAFHVNTEEHPCISLRYNTPVQVARCDSVIESSVKLHGSEHGFDGQNVHYLSTRILYSYYDHCTQCSAQCYYFHASQGYQSPIKLEN